MAVHVVELVPRVVIGGTTYSKDEITIAQRAAGTVEFRVKEDSSIASSSGYPDVKRYIELEDAAGFKVQYFGQNYIITYSA